MLNCVVLVGRLTKDVEVKEGAEKSFVVGSIAVNEGKDETGNSIVSFFDFSAYKEVAKTLYKYTSKGSKIALRGRLKQRTYTNSKGVNVNSVSIIVDSVDLLDSKPEEETKEDTKKSKDNTKESSNVNTKGVTKSNGMMAKNSKNSVEVAKDDLPF